jgi:hypothetical protein
MTLLGTPALSLRFLPGNTIINTTYSIINTIYITIINSTSNTCIITIITTRSPTGALVPTPLVRSPELTALIIHYHFRIRVAPNNPRLSVPLRVPTGRQPRHHFGIRVAPINPRLNVRRQHPTNPSDHK